MNIDSDKVDQTRMVMKFKVYDLVQYLDSATSLIGMEFLFAWKLLPSLVAVPLLIKSYPRRNNSLRALNWRLREFVSSPKANKYHDKHENGI